jgi:hypothetical protein
MKTGDLSMPGLLAYMSTSSLESRPEYYVHLIYTCLSLRGKILLQTKICQGDQCKLILVLEHGNPCSNPKAYSSRTVEIKKRKYKSVMVG